MPYPDDPSDQTDQTDQTQDLTDQLDQSRGLGSQVTPDAAAAASTAADQTGLSPGVALRDPRGAAALAALRSAVPASQIVDQTPQLAEWIAAQPRRATLAQGDEDALQQLARTMARLPSGSAYDRAQYDDAIGLQPGAQRNADDSISETINGPDGKPGGMANYYPDVRSYLAAKAQQGDQQALEAMVAAEDRKTLDEQLGWVPAALALPVEQFLQSAFPSDPRRAEVLEQDYRLHPEVWRTLPALLGGATDVLGQVAVPGEIVPSLIGRAVGEIPAAAGLAGRTALWRAGESGLGEISPAARMQRLGQIFKPLMGDQGSLLRQQVEQVAAFAPQSASQSLQDYQQHGSLAHAAVDFLSSEAIVGAVPASGLGRALTGGKILSNAEVAAGQGIERRLPGLLESLGLQATQGALFPLASAINDRATLGKPINGDDLIHQMAIGGAFGGALGGLMTLAHGEGVQQIQRAEQSQATLSLSEQLGQAVDAMQRSQLAERSPADMEALVSHLAQGGLTHVYVSPEDWVAHWQAQGQDPEAQAAQAQAAESLKLARASGGRMQVALPQYLLAAARSTKGRDLIAKARYAPDGPHADEAAAALKTIPEEVVSRYKELSDELAKQVGDAVTTGSDAQDQIHDELLHQLFIAHPAATTEQLDTWATRAASLFDVLGKRTKQDPLELFRSYPITITGDPGLMAAHAKTMAALESGDAAALHDAGTDLVHAGTGMSGDLLAKGTEDAKASLADEIRAAYAQGQNRLGQPPKPVPDSGDLGRQSLKAHWKQTHNGQAPKLTDPAWKKLVEQARKVDEAKGGSPAMQKLRELDEYEAGQRNEISSSGKRIVVADVPYGAGMSKDGKTVYIDRRIPRVLQINGHRINVHELIALHEETEHPLMTAGETYQKAHPQAEKVEDHAADALIPHADYENALKPYLAQALRRADKAGIPIDLDEHPYHDMGQKYLIEGRSGPAANETKLAQPGNRGELHFGPTGGFRLQLNRTAETSTFMHEMMHAAFEIIGREAQKADAPDKLKADYQAMLDFSGYTTHEGKESALAEARQIDAGAAGRELTPAEQQRISELTAGHEKIATGFEQYLLEGKAPNEELASVFGKIKAWMVSAYRQNRDLGVQLTPEIRGVFDRIISADDAVDDAATKQGMDPIFTSAEQAGMTAEQFSAYQAKGALAKEQAQHRLERKVLAQYRKSLSDVIKTEREHVRAAMADHVAKQRPFAAMNALQNGLDPLGREMSFPGYEKTKLSRQELVDRYGKEILGKLPGRGNKNNPGRPIYTERDGVPLDHAAQSLGYSTGDEMIQELLAAPSRDQLVGSLTDQAMKARTAELFGNDPAMQQAAGEAIHSRAQEEMDRAELEALERLAAAGTKNADAEREEGAKIVRKPIPQQSIKQMRATARILASRSRYRDLNPELYKHAAASEARKVEAAILKGDYRGAADAKFRKVFADQMFKAHTDAKERAGKALDFARQFDRPATRERIAKAGAWEWTVQMPDGSSQRFDSQEQALKASQQAGNAPMSRSSGYLEQIDGLRARFDLRRMSQSQLERRESLQAWMQRQNEAGIPVSIPPHLLLTDGKIPWRTATVRQLTDLGDALRSISAAANHKNKLLAKARLSSLQAEVNDQVASMEANGPKAKKLATSEGPVDQLTKWVPESINYAYRVPDLAYRLDGYEHGGAVQRGWQDPINRATDDQAVMNAEDIAEMNAIQDRWGKLSRYGSPTTWRNNWKLYQLEWIPEINEGLSKWTQIMVAYNWGNEGNRERLMEGHGWTPTQVHAIIEHLDAADKRFVEDLWRLTSKRRTEIGALEERVHGVQPEWVEPTPFTTSHGEWAGGYAPIVYDGKRAVNPHAQTIDDENPVTNFLSGRGGAYAMTAHGHTKERGESQGRPLKLDFSVITNHINQVNKDLALRETLIDANRMLKNETWRTAVSSRLGVGGYEQFKHQLTALAGVQDDIPVGFGKWLEFVRQSSNAARRSFNVVGAVKQVFGIVSTLPRVGPVAFSRAIRDAFNPASHRWVESIRPAMRFRNADRGKLLNEPYARTDVLGPLNVFKDTAYFAMNKSWKVLDAHAWFAHYYMAKDQGKTEEEAQAIGDQGVASTQGATHTKDMAQMMRGGPLAKAFTNNMSYDSAMFNLLVASVQRYTDKGRTPAESVKLASDMLVYLIAAPVIYSLGSAAVTGSDMSDWLSHPIKHVRNEAAYTLLSTIPLGREGADIFSDGHRSDGIQGTAGLQQLIQAGFDARRAMDRAMDPNAKPERERPGITPWERAAIRAMGVLFHTPTDAILHALDGWIYAELHGGNHLVRPFIGPPQKQ